MLVEMFQQSSDLIPFKKARCPPTEKNCLQAAFWVGPLNRFEICNQSIDVVRCGQIGFQGVRVEISVRALAFAPGQVNVQCQGKRNEGVQSGRQQFLGVS